MTSGGAFGIDAPFGHGKTFFVNGFASELRREGYRVVYFDAWRADLAVYPLFLFVSEVLSQLSEQGVSFSEKPAVAERLGKLASAVARIGLKTVLRAGDADLDDLADPFVSEVDRLDFAKRGAASDALALAGEVEAARESFCGAVNALFVESQEKLPLLVVVDELDRVRPDFAIEFLEALKFVFSTERVVFCVAVDRQNLMAALRAKFGQAYDVEQYLARLFSFWVRLENPRRNVAFIASALRRRGLIADGILSETDGTDDGIGSLSELALVGLGGRADNLRAMDRCAERATICARALSPNRWDGLVGFLCGLSVSNRDFLHEYVGDMHALNLRGGPADPNDPEPDFLNRLEQVTRGSSRWVRVATVVWAFQPTQLEGMEHDLTQVFDQQVAVQALGAAREIMSRRHLYNQSAASLVHSQVGWALG
jgi:hypothetical protein